MPGYSGTPLLKKLGIKPGMRVFIVGAPDGFVDSLDLKPLARPAPDLDFIHIFSKSQSDLQKQLERLKPLLASNGMLWISWPKKASKVPTDLDENVVRTMGLASGIVDIKVCAVDDIWSGHKFVIRLKDRVKK